MSAPMSEPMSAPMSEPTSEPPNLRIQLSLARADFRLQVELAVPARGITVVFGPSGCGKTTLLRCVAGLEKADGRIAMGPAIWQDSARKWFKPTWQREIGYVFQEASLFEHLNVRQNLHFGLRRAPKTSHSSGLDAALELLGIGHLLDRAVHSLSGGERQRVAIARALVTNPDCVLADEPTGNLDRATADGVFELMLDLARKQGTAFVVVTHDATLAARCTRQLHLVQGKLAPAH